MLDKNYLSRGCNYPADGLPSFDQCPITSVCRAKTAQNGLEILQLLHSTPDMCIRARKSLPWAYDYIWIRDLHIDNDQMRTSAII